MSSQEEVRYPVIQVSAMLYGVEAQAEMESSAQFSSMVAAGARTSPWNKQKNKQKNGNGNGNGHGHHHHHGNNNTNNSNGSNNNNNNQQNNNNDDGDEEHSHDAELVHLRKLVSAYNNYENDCLDKVRRCHRDFDCMKASHKALLPKYKQHLQSMENCAAANYRICKQITRTTTHIFGDQST
jgi:hypothetical protein